MSTSLEPRTPSVDQPEPMLGTAGLSPAAPSRFPSNRKSQITTRKSNAWIYALLAIGSLAFLVPFYFVLNASLKTDAEVQAGDFITPTRAPALGNYARSMEKMGLTWWDTGLHLGSSTLKLPASFPALSNTVVITVLVIAGQILSCSLVGFGFARFKFRGRNTLFILMLSTMMLPAQVTMIPMFLLFKSLGMIDSIWPLALPAFFASPFYVFMFRQFFAQVPEELIEAARIDGCSNWRIYWQMMLPLSGPVIAIVAIYTFLGTWNDFLGPLIYLNSPGSRTLAIELNSFKGQYGNTDAHLLMAASVVCMLPCVLLFFAAQKYFVQSVAQTGMK
ncbi:MAG: carbohydrate ABC transporter permease [Tepidisphaeraceae bacterium]